MTLVKGASGAHAKYSAERRPKLLTYLGGKKIEKQALKENDATLYNYFEKTWGARNRHMVKNLPQPCVFMLLPCKMKDCPHPKCQPNAKDFDNTWFPAGPKLNYFPIPIADPKCPWGGSCESAMEIVLVTISTQKTITCITKRMGQRG